MKINKQAKTTWNTGVSVGVKIIEWGFGIGLGILSAAATVHVSKELDKKAEGLKVK